MLNNESSMITARIGCKLTQANLEKLNNYAARADSTSSQSQLSPEVNEYTSSHTARTKTTVNANNQVESFWRNEYQSKINILAGQCGYPVAFAAGVLEQVN